MVVYLIEGDFRAIDGDFTDRTRQIEIQEVDEGAILTRLILKIQLHCELLQIFEFEEGDQSIQFV